MMVEGLGWEMNLTMQKNGSDGVSLRREEAPMNVRQAKQTARDWWRPTPKDGPDCARRTS